MQTNKKFLAGVLVIFFLIFVGYFVINKKPSQVILETENQVAQNQNTETTDQTPIISTENMETENITTPAYIVGFNTKDNKTFVELDYVTRVNPVDYLIYQINNNDCNLPNMSKAEAIEYVKKQLIAYEQYSREGERMGDMSIIANNCILDLSTFSISNPILNQNSKSRSFPLSSNFTIVNTCQNFPVLVDIKNKVIEEPYKYNIYNSEGGYFIPSITVVNNEVIKLDFVNGCAG